MTIAAVPLPHADSAQPTTPRARFEAFYEVLASEIIHDIEQEQGVPPEALAWVRHVMDYNVPGGKLNRGLTVPDSLRVILGRELTPEEDVKAMTLGWCIEWLQAFFLVADDIMDSSVTRRGQPCWYRRPEVGMIAVNDSFILESCIYRLLRKHFRSEPYYIDLLELLQEISWKTELGQLLDLITAPEENVDLNRFSMDKYKWIVKYKTAFYSFYLPVAMALILANRATPSSLADAKTTMLALGEYFQVQDDFLDCYGDPAVIGKIGTDIYDNKCSWLIVRALELADDSVRQRLAASYGRKGDAAGEARVKEIYRELDIAGEYHRYEEASYQSIMEECKRMDSRGADLPSEVVRMFVGKIYKRQK